MVTENSIQPEMTFELANRVIFATQTQIRFARHIMPLGENVQGLAGGIILRDLPLELDTMGSVSGHGFHPLKARHPRSIPCPPAVRPQGGALQSGVCPRAGDAKLLVARAKTTFRLRPKV